MADKIILSAFEAPASNELTEDELDTLYLAEYASLKELYDLEVGSNG